MKTRHKVLLLLVLLSIITYLDRVCMNIVSKYVKAELNLDNEQFGYVLGAFSLAYALFEFPTGWLGDKIGARSVLTRVVLWWSVFTMLTGSATNFAFLLLYRFLFGMGEAGAYPNASIAIAHWFPKSEIGKAQAAIWGAARLGGSLTPLLVLPLVHAFGWRMAFVVLGFMGITWALVWFLWYRNNPAEMKGIDKEEVVKINAERLALGAKHSVGFSQVIKNKNVILLMVMCHFLFYASYFFTNWSNTFFQEGRGMTENESKHFISLSYFLGALGAFSGGYLSDYLCKRIGLNWGRRSVAMAGLMSSSFLFFLVAFISNKQTTGLLLSLCVFLKDLALPIAFAVCVDVGRKFSGAVVGAMNFAGQLGGFFITILFGIIVQNTHNFNYPVLLIGASLFICAVMWFFITPDEPIAPAES